jgi:uncharacterized membrane protein YcaP (DUF421 family)
MEGLGMSVVVMRTVVLYIVIVFALRIMGKRQLGELQPAELVVTILVSNIATLSIEDTNIPLLGSILPIFMLVSCEVLVSVIILKSGFARKLISGNPRILIRDGVLDQKEMRNLRWSIDDVTEQLRMNNIFNIRDVSFGIVETSGNLSAYQKFSARPVTTQMMNIPANGEPDAPPLPIIVDGVLDRDALAYLNLKEEWLNNVLKEKQLSVKDIFLMTCDRRARYQIDLKEMKDKRRKQK